MIATIRRNASIYWAVGAMAPKFFLAYRGWVWLGLFTSTLTMTISVFFWRAVYAGTDSIGGLNYQQALNYIVLAQVLGPAAGDTLVHFIGSLMREGAIGIELIRPVDFQAANYVRRLGSMVTLLLLALPLLGVAFAYGLHLSTDPLVWGAFAIALLLGVTVLFVYDWAFSTLAFYTTEVWGLMVLQYGIALFLSGMFLPLDMMPDWLRHIASVLPFAQSLYVPAGILSGTIPLADVPGKWLIQIIWIVGGLFASRLIFRIAVRKVTVQGG